MNAKLITATFLFAFLACRQKSAEGVLAGHSDLKVGVATPRATLKKHAVDTFRLSLEKDVMVYGYADQLTADMVVEIYGPDKKMLRHFDGPARGPESFDFNSTMSGIYKIVVTPFEDQTGDYTLLLKGVETLATNPEGRVDQMMRVTLGDSAITPGASIAVQRDGKLIYSKGFGYADLEYGIKNTPTTIFHIASVSKQFTAFAIAMLADQRKLSLNDDIRKYLPELHDFGDVITINHLVHHTSGLRDQWNLLMMAGWRLDDVITQKQIMRVISRQRDLNFKPGEEMLYCNTGFTLMAEIVSRVTGESFPEWTRKNIFEPLDMKNTLFYDDHEKIVKNRAYSYYETNGGYKKSVLNYANVGATSLFTTVEDLNKWAVNFEKMEVGNQNVMKLMNQRFVLNKGDTINYAFGQSVDKYKGLNAYSHSGGDAGYRSYLLRFPDQHFSVAVFSNLASFNPGAIGYALADLYLAKDIKPEKVKEETPAPPQPKVLFDASKMKLSDYTGTFYSPELETSYAFEVVHDTLVSHHQRHDDFKFIPVKEDGFTSRGGYLGSIDFTRDAKKKVTGLKASNGRVRNLVFTKQVQ
jgi:CubicO group peptidase (beta-lactamase class C family)